MRFIVAGIFMTGLVANVSPALARCGDTAGDEQKVADARTAVAGTCNCATATSHGAYVSCAAGVAKQRADDNLLPRNCKGAVVKCAAKSTCGKAGFVTCCRTKASGATKCSIKRTGAHCTAPSGGSACAGTQSSCCDACTSSGCASPSGAFVFAP
jgi:hypothetical protein